MDRYKLALILVIFYILTGCSYISKHRDNTDNDRLKADRSVKLPQSQEDTSRIEVKDVMPTADNTPSYTPTPENKVQSSPAKGSQVAQPQGKGEVFDFDVLNKFDNTKYSWGLSLNSRHETPGIPSYARKLLIKHNGIFTGDTSKKVVYLTFDEGYENGYTPKILDTLKENNIKALFFITGAYIKSHPELVKRMLDEGHEVGNHTMNHPSLPSVSNPTLEKELYGLEKEFKSRFDRHFKYMRVPRGDYSEKVLAAAELLGYKTVFWSFAYVDYDVNNQRGADYAYNMVMNNLHNGAVILLHAVSKDNAEALDMIIKNIIERGYEIKPFDL